MAYTPEDSWIEFETTGSIAAYLAYRERSTKTSDSSLETNRDEESEQP